MPVCRRHHTCMNTLSDAWVTLEAISSLILSSLLHCLRSACLMLKMASGSRSNETIGMKLTLAGIRKKFTSVKGISTSELQDAVDGKTKDRDFMILDVREKEEFYVSHLPNAVLVDESMPTKDKLAFVEKLLMEKPCGEDQATNIYIYCSVGYRSSALVSDILASGLQSRFAKNVILYNITGGIFQWVNENRPVVNIAGERTEMVHPYNTVFGKLLYKKHRHKIKK